MDMEGDLGVNLVLGQPFLRPVLARIDVGRGEICFRVGKEDMFFMFKQREEQRFMIQQDNEGQALWGSPEPHLKNLEPPDPKEDDQRRCGVRLRVRPRPLLQDEPNNGKSVQEKGPARQTQNDEPLPKVNQYLSHI